MRPYILLLLGFVLFAFPVSAQTTGQVIADAVFSEVEKRVIEEYLDKAGDKEARKEGDADSDDDEDEGKKDKDKKGKKDKKEKGKKKDKSKKMPPGLAKKKELPPGLARQLEKNGTLPPGLASRGLPEDLEEKLPETNKDLERVLVDESVVLVEKATGRILDIITGRNK